MLALQHFLLEPAVEGFQGAGPLLHAQLQIALRLAAQFDALQVVALALQPQAEQRQHGEQHQPADAEHAAHRPIDQAGRRIDAHRPVDFLQRALLRQPDARVERERLQLAGRIRQVEGDRRLLLFRLRAGGAKAPVGVGGEDHHALPVGDHQSLRGLAPQRFRVVQIDLHHQHAERLAAVVQGGGKVVAALAGGVAQAEETPQVAVHGFAKVRPKGEVAPDEAVLLVPVGRRQGQALAVHQIDRVGAGLLLQTLEQMAGLLRPLVLRTEQCAAQHRQVAENARQRLVAAQDAQQVGDIQIQRLAVLLGQLGAVMAFSQMMQRPEQRRQQHGEQGNAAPARAAGEQRKIGHGAIYLAGEAIG